jgi:hypothetical protein
MKVVERKGPRPPNRDAEPPQARYEIRPNGNPRSKNSRSDRERNYPWVIVDTGLMRVVAYHASKRVAKKDLRRWQKGDTT